MEQTVEQFKAAIKNKAGSISKVRNSWGVYDYYKYYRKNRPKEHKYALTESQYYAIIRKVNKLYVENILKFGELELPYRMGRVIMMKAPVNTRIKNNKVITTRRIDWNKTLELWYKDESAYKNRNLIYSQSSENPCVMYVKKDAIFKNKQYYEFSLHREIVKRIIPMLSDFQSVLSNSEIGNIKGLYDG